VPATDESPGAGLDGCSASCGVGRKVEARTFVGPAWILAAQALCNTSSALRQTSACNVQPCPQASNASFPFVSFTTVLSTSVSSLSLGAAATDGNASADSSSLLAVMATRQQLRANISLALQRSIDELVADGNVTLSLAASAWLRNVSASDVLMSEPVTAAGARSSDASASSVAWRLALPMDGASAGGTAVSAGLLALLQSPAGVAVAREIALLVRAAVVHACELAARGADTTILGACPADTAPLAVWDPPTQLAASPANAGGGNLSGRDSSAGAPTDAIGGAAGGAGLLLVASVLAAVLHQRRQARLRKASSQAREPALLSALPVEAGAGSDGGLEQSTPPPGRAARGARNGRSAGGAYLLRSPSRARVGVAPDEPSHGGEGAAAPASPTQPSPQAVETVGTIATSAPATVADPPASADVPRDAAPRDAWNDCAAPTSNPLVAPAGHCEEPPSLTDGQDLPPLPSPPLSQPPLALKECSSLPRAPTSDAPLRTVRSRSALLATTALASADAQSGMAGIAPLPHAPVAAEGPAPEVPASARTRTPRVPFASTAAGAAANVSPSGAAGLGVSVRVGPLTGASATSPASTRRGGAGSSAAATSEPSPGGPHSVVKRAASIKLFKAAALASVATAAPAAAPRVQSGWSQRNLLAAEVSGAEPGARGGHTPGPAAAARLDAGSSAERLAAIAARRTPVRARVVRPIAEEAEEPADAAGAPGWHAASAARVDGSEDDALSALAAGGRHRGIGGPVASSLRLRDVSARDLLSLPSARLEPRLANGCTTGERTAVTGRHVEEPGRLQSFSRHLSMRTLQADPKGRSGVSSSDAAL